MSECAISECACERRWEALHDVSVRRIRVGSRQYQPAVGRLEFSIEKPGRATVL